MLEAEGPDEARSELGKRGLIVKYLSAVAESKIVFQESKRESGIRFEPPEQQTYVPTLGERWEAFTAPGKAQTTFLLLVLSMGLLLMFAGFLKSGWNGPKQIGDVQVVEVILKGEVAVGAEPDGTKVQVVFPEVPLTLEFEGSEVLSPSGELNLESSFHTRRPPGYCDLVLEREGMSPLRLRDLRLSGTPLQATVAGLAWERESRD